MVDQIRKDKRRKRLQQKKEHTTPANLNGKRKPPRKPYRRSDTILRIESDATLQSSVGTHDTLTAMDETIAEEHTYGNTD